MCLDGTTRFDVLRNVNADGADPPRARGVAGRAPGSVFVSMLRTWPMTREGSMNAHLRAVVEQINHAN